MSRGSSKGSKDKSIRPSSLGQLRRILDDSDFINYDRAKAPSVPEPESLANFYSRLREGNKLPFTLNQLGVAVDRALSVDEYKAESWMELRKDHELKIAEGIGSPAVARACYLDLGIEQVEERRISFGGADGWFSPARRALAEATGQRVKDVTPHREHRAAIAAGREVARLREERNRRPTPQVDFGDPCLVDRDEDCWYPEVDNPNYWG